MLTNAFRFFRKAFVYDLLKHSRVRAAITKNSIPLLLISRSNGLNVLIYRTLTLSPARAGL